MNMTVLKEEIPFYGRPPFWVFSGLNFIGIFLAGVLIVPLARPGVVESVFGIVWALVFPWLHIRAWIAYLEQMAVKARRSRLAKILPTDFGAEWAQVQVGAMLWIGGAIASVLSAYAVYLVAPELSDPWARYGNIPSDFPVPIRSMATSAFVYFVASGLLLSLSIVRWFRALPSAGDHPDED